MEARLLLSITPVLHDEQTAAFVGGDQTDALYLRVAGDSVLEFSETGLPGSYFRDLDPGTPGDQTLTPSLSTAITVQLAGGDDTLFIQFSAATNLQFDGGAGFDSLELDGGSYDTLRFLATAAGSGEVWRDANSLGYSGLEAIVDTMDSANRVIGLSNGADADATLSAQSETELKLVGTTFPSIIFPIPTQSLTIDGLAGTDFVTVNPVIDLGSTNLTVIAEQILVADSAEVTTTGDITLTAVGENHFTGSSSPSPIDVAAKILVQGDIEVGGSLTLDATVNNTVDVEASGASLAVESKSSAVAQIGSGATVTAGNLVVSAVTHTRVSVDITDAASGGSGLGGTVVEGGRGNLTRLGGDGPADFYLWNSTALDLDQPTYVVTHGWRDGLHDLDSWIPLLNALEQYDSQANVIFTDWSEESTNLYYPTAADNTFIIGGLLATFLDQAQIDPSTTTLIGHSLGGQVSGIAADRYASIPGNSSLARVVALDPAGPFFEPTLWSPGKDVDHRLDATDADRVVALHTTSILGYDDPVGDLDLYVNPALAVQPGEANFAGSHSYAVTLLTQLLQGKSFSQAPGSPLGDDFDYADLLDSSLVGSAEVETFDSPLEITTVAGIEGGAVIVAGTTPISASESASVLVRAVDDCQLRSGIATSPLSDPTEFDFVQSKIGLRRDTRAYIGDATQRTTLHNVADSPAGLVKVTAQNRGHIAGQVVSDFLDYRATTFARETLLAYVENADLNVTGLDVHAENSSAYATVAAENGNTVRGVTRASASSSTVQADAGGVTLSAVDRSSYTATSPGQGKRSSLNDIKKDVSAHVADSTMTVTDGSIRISADNRTAVNATSTLPTPESVLDAANIFAMNVVNGNVDAYAEGSTLTTTNLGSITLEAENAAAVDARVTGETTATSAPLVLGSAVSFGSAVAFNAVGWDMANVLWATIEDLLGDPANDWIEQVVPFAESTPARVNAYLRDTAAVAGGDLTIGARSAAQLNATVSNAAQSTASSLYGASSKGAGGVLSTNKIDTSAGAWIDYSESYAHQPGSDDVSAGGAISILASDDAGIYANAKFVPSSITTNDGGARVIQETINDSISADFLSSDGSCQVEFGQRVRIAGDYLTGDFGSGDGLQSLVEGDTIVLADEYAMPGFTSDSGRRLVVTGDFVKLADDYSGAGQAGAVYRYLGGNGRVDLGTQDYADAALWAKVGGTAGAAYRFLGSGAALDLGAVDYGDTSLWKKLVGAAGSVYQYLGTAATLDLGQQDYSDLGYWKELPATQIIPQGYNVSGSNALAVGGLVVLNEVCSDVAADIKDATIVAGAISLAALETAVIRADADSNAVASGGSAYGAGSETAVNGNIATNVILSKANADITGSTITTTAGDLVVEAGNLSQIDATTHSATTSGDKAVGVTLAFNSVGWKAQNLLFNTLDALLGDPSKPDAFGDPQPAEVQATIADSTLDVAGDLVVTGISEATINAAVDTQATSAAVAVIGASGASAGAVLANNKVAIKALASVDFTGAQGTVEVGGGVTVAAEDYAAINARCTLEAISTVTNDSGLGILGDLVSTFLTDYQYSTNSGTQDVLRGQLVRIAEGYTGGGTPGEVYLYSGLGETLDLGTVDYAASPDWNVVLLDDALDLLHNLGLNVSASDSTAVGALVVRNDVRGTVEAYLENADVDAGGTFSVAAAESAAIRAVDRSTVTAEGGSVGVKDSSLAVNAVIATNLVLSDATARVTDSDVTTAGGGDVLVEASNVSAIDARVASDTTSRGTSVGITLAFNTIGWNSQNFLYDTVDALLGTGIGVEIPAGVQARIERSEVDAAGAIRVNADSDARVAAEITGGATAIKAKVGDATAVSVGAVMAMNKSSTLTRSVIDDATAVVARDGDVQVTASDASRIESDVEAAALSVSATMFSGLSVAVGVSVARNEVRNDMQARVRGVGALTAVNGSVLIGADQSANIAATSSASAITVGLSSRDNKAFSGGGATAVNVIAGTSNAFIQDSSVTAAGTGAGQGQVALSAVNSSGIDATVKAISVSGGAGTGTTPAVAIGFSLARNLIGWHEYGGKSPIDVRAYVTDTGAADATVIHAARGLTVTAAVGGRVHAVVEATAGALAASTNSAFAVAGAGLWTDNKIAATVQAEIIGADVIDVEAEGVNLSATNTASIVADARAVALTASLAGTTGGAVSIGLSLAHNTVDNDVAAFIRNTGPVLTNGTDVSVTATDHAGIHAVSIAAAVSAGIGGSTGFAVSGGGAEATNVILTRTNASIEGSALGTVGEPVGDVGIFAGGSAEIEALIGAVAGSVSFGGTTGVGVALGVGVARNFIGWNPRGTTVAADYSSHDDPTELTTGCRVRIASGPMAGEVFEYLGATLTDGDPNVAGDQPIDLSTQNYQDKTVWRPASLAVSPAEIQARILDASIHALGTLTLEAVADESIDAIVLAGAAALSGGGTTGVGVSGAGVYTENRIRTLVRACIDGDGDEAVGDGINAGAVSLDARDASAIRAVAGAASLAGSVGGTAGVSVAIGLSLAFNEVSNDVAASIANADEGVFTHSGGPVAIGAAAQGQPLFELNLGGALTAASLDDAAQEDEGSQTAVDLAEDYATLEALRTAFEDRAERLAVDDTVATASLYTTEFGDAVDLRKGTTVKLGDAYAHGGTPGRVYRYLGPDRDDVDLGTEDYGDGSSWLRVEPLKLSRLGDGQGWTLVAPDGSTYLLELRDNELLVGRGTISAVSAAAALAAGLGGTAGVAVSGGGAVAQNVVLSKVNAYADASRLGSVEREVGDVLLNAASEATINSAVLAASRAIGGGGTAGVGVSIGVAVAQNFIGRRPGDSSETAAEVQAYLKNTSVQAGGALALIANASQTINSMVLAGSSAVGLGGTAGVGASGSGVHSENRIGVRVQASIDGDGTEGILAHSVTLTARDTSTINALAGAASLAASLGGTVGVSIAIGASVARNEIRNVVESFIINADTGVTSTEEAISLEALEAATIHAASVAASLAAAFSAGLSIALSGAGARALNVINNTVQAYIADSTVTAESGDVLAQAWSSASITALVGAASGAVSGGIAAAAGAMGVSIARNLVGRNAVDDATGLRNQVLAYVENSTVVADGDVWIQATSTDRTSAISFAGSVAIAAGIGGAAAGSGAEAINRHSSKIHAFVRDSTVQAGLSIDVRATSDSQITRASAIGAALSASLAAASVAASVVQNDIRNEVRAELGADAAAEISARGSITVAALALHAGIRDATAVTASVSAGLYGMSGGGIEITNVVANVVEAGISGPLSVIAGGDVEILAAEEDAFVSADAAAATVSYSLGAALGTALVSNQISSSITASVQGLSEAAEARVTSANLTVRARSVADARQTRSAGVSGSAAAAQANVSHAVIRTSVGAFTRHAELTASEDIIVEATAENSAAADAAGGALGAIAAGAMIAEVNLGRGNEMDEVQAVLGDNTSVQARRLTVRASSSDDLLSESTAAGGGVLAAAGADSRVTSDNATLARIGSNALIQVDTLAVDSTHEQDIDAAADSYALALASGSGAQTSVTITGQAKVEIDSGARVTAGNILIGAQNVLTKNRYPNASNLKSGSASGASATLLQSTTDIGTQAVVNIGVGAELTVQGDSSHPGVFTIEALNDICAADRVRVESVSGFGYSKAVSRVDSDTLAAVNVLGATLASRRGDIYLTAMTNSDVTSSANLLVATALTGAAGAEATARTGAANRINITDARIQAADVHLVAGRNSADQSDVVRTSANTELRTFSMLPNIAVPKPTAEIDETNEVQILGNSIVQALENVHLVASQPTEGGARRKTTGLALSLSLIPYGYPVPDYGADSRIHSVLIGPAAHIEAGLNSQTVTAIKPVTVNEHENIDPLRLDGTPAERRLSEAEKTAEGITDSGAEYEYSALNMDEISFRIYTGTVVEIAPDEEGDPVAGGGIVGGLYRYAVESEDPVQIVLHREDYSNTRRWEKVEPVYDLKHNPPQEPVSVAPGEFVRTADDVLYQYVGEHAIELDLGSADFEALETWAEIAPAIFRSDVAVSFQEWLRNKFYVVKPTSVDSPTMSLENVGRLLLAQRGKILDWMANHSSNAEAVARYQVQLELIEAALIEMELLEEFPDPDTPGAMIRVAKEGLDVLVINLPEMSAAPGSIFIEADAGGSGAVSPLVGTQLLPKAGANLQVSNETPFSLVVHELTIRDTRRTTVVDGEYTVFTPGHVYYNSAPLTQIQTPAKTIAITQPFLQPGADYGLEQGQSLPVGASQDIYVHGDIINETGTVSITNRNGSINVSGEIRAQEVNIHADEDFNLNTEGWFHNRDPRQSSSFDSYRQQVFNPAGTLTTATYSALPPPMDFELIATLDNLMPPPNAQFGYSVAVSGDLVAIGAPYADYDDVKDTGAVYLFSAVTRKWLRTILNPSPGEADQFGYSVAISGDLIIAGAPRAHETGVADSGEVWLFDAIDPGFAVEINNPTPADYDLFGFSVAVAGDMLVVGTPYADYSGAENPGAAYVFDLQRPIPTGLAPFWTLTNWSPDDSDLFGYSVAVSDEIIAVGTPYCDYSGKTNIGAVYVFDVATRQRLPTLLNPRVASYDYFGYSVAVTGSTVVVGAPDADPGGLTNAGAAYLFSARTGGRLQTFSHPTPAANDQFGLSVAVSGDRVLVGAPLDDVGGVADSGAAYLFSAETGSLVQTLAGPGPAGNDQFGFSMAMSEDRILVGTPLDDDRAVLNCGAAHLFSVEMGELLQTFTNPTSATGDHLGHSVAVSGDIVAVGIPYADYSGKTDTGRVDLFSASTGQWLRTITNPSPGDDDQFGYSVAVSRDLIIVGAPRAHEPTVADSGEVWIFDATDEDFAVEISNPTPADFDLFGFSVAVAGDMLVVGTPYADYSGGENTGAAYVFDLQRPIPAGLAPFWTLTNGTPDNGDRFAFSVAASEEIIAVGTPYCDYSGKTDIGAVYVFDVASRVRLPTILNPRTATSEWFGYSVAVTGNTVVVGAPMADPDGLSNAGAAYAFSASTGSLLRTFGNPTASAGDEFGFSVAVSQDNVVVGTPFNDYSGLADAGAAYLFSAETGALLLTANPTPAADNQFGYSVAASGNRFVAGAPLLDRAGATNTGAAYVFQQAADSGRSAIVAQGRVAVTAAYLNINGLIQSGVQTMTLHVDPTFTAPATSSLLDDDGNPLAGIQFGEDEMPVNAYFDHQKQAIVVDEIVSRGGEIVLAGQILSTGGGELKVAHGYASLDIDNRSPYDLILNRIDTTKNREGRVTIVDTGKLQKVEYVLLVDPAGVEQVRETTYQGTLTEGDATGSGGVLSGMVYTELATQTHSPADPMSYQPRTGLQYVWTEGQEKSRVVTSKYEKKSFNLIGFDWDGLVTDTSYKWQTTTFRDAFPLLESEVPATTADYCLPALAEDFSGGEVAAWTDPANPYALHWKIVDEGTISPPSHWFVANKTLVQNSNIYGDATIDHRKGTYLVYVDEARQADQWRNYELSVDLYCTDNDGVGVMFRYLDSSNYYKLEMDYDRSFRKLFKVAGGVETVLWSDSTRYSLNQWFNITVRVVEARVQILIDGVTQADVTDSSPLPRGTVAMYCWGQEGVKFDNIHVQHLSPFIVASLEPGQTVRTGDGRLYRYQGAPVTDLDLTTVDFDQSSQWVPAIEVPTYVDDNAYTIQYVLLDDTDVELVPNVDIVKVVADANQGGVVDHRYLYVGAPAELVLSEQNYSVTQQWSDVTGTTSDADVDYRSSFKNFTSDARTWVTGGGWLTQKTYHTLLIQTFGQKDYYTHTLKADYPIAISYRQAPASPSIRIAAAGNVYLQETITAPRQGTLSLTSLQGDIVFGETAAVLGASPTIQAGGRVRVNVEGGAVASGAARAASLGFQAEPSVLSITSAGDLELHAVHDPYGNGSDTIIVGQIVSTGGNVILVAPGGIQAHDEQSIVRGNRIELVAVNGGIGSAALPLAIDSDRLGSGGVAARALGDIHIREVQGDLKLAAPRDEQNWAASVQSVEGNVTLQVAAGSILDAVQEDLETRTQEEIEAYAQQMQLTGDDARQAVATALRSEEGLRTERYHDYWREYRQARPSIVVRQIAIQNLDADNDVISFSQPHDFQSGDEVFVGSADAAKPGFAYYAVVTSATSVQLATTRYDAVLRDVPVVMDITPPWIELHEEQSLLVYDYSVLALSDPSLGEVPEIFGQVHETYGAGEYDPNFFFQFSPDQRQERIDARTFSGEALRSPVAASLFGLLYPAAGSAGGSAGGEERSNIVGQQITLLVGAGTVGRAGTPLDVSLSAGFEDLSEDERQTLAMSTKDDVLAVDYAVYQFQGDAGDVDLLKADFSDNVTWEKLLPDYEATGATQWEWLEIGDTVQVRVPLGAGGEPQFGVYRYQGGAAAWLDLSRQDYTGNGDWDSVAQFDAIEGARALSPGDCVGRIEGLTVETTNDIDLEVQVGLTIEAEGAVWVASVGELRIESIAASGAVRLQAGGSIINLGTGSLAMPELTARSGQDIHLLGITGPVLVSEATALGNIELSVADSASPNDDLVLADGANIRATAGSVALDAGDSLVVPATSRIAAAGGVSLRVDFGDVDPDLGGTIQILGSIDAATTAITGGSDGDSITLNGVAAGNVTTIQAGGGDDEIRVGDELGQVLGPMILDAGSGSDRLILRDDGNGSTAPEQAGRIETARVRGFGMPADGWIEHQGLESLTITTGQAADAIEIDSTASLLLTVETGDGADFVEIYHTGSGSATEIRGGSGDDTVRIRGADALGAVNFEGGGHGSQGDRLLFGPQGYATEPAVIPDPVPAGVTTLGLRDGAGNPVGPVHTFSTVEHVIILPPPTGIALTPWGLPENTDTGDENVEVGQFEAFSQIAGAGCTFSLVAGSGDDDNGRFVLLDERLFLKQGTLLDYELQPLYTVRVRVSDGFDHVDRQFGVAVTDVNEAPELMQPIPNQSATENVPFLFQLAADAFRDPDAGDVLSYSATLGDGSPLPSWLSFDDPTRTFRGRPGFTDEGQLTIVVRATDSGTPPLARATTFELMVMPNAVPWQNPENRWDVDASGSPSDPFPGDVLALINFINARGILQLPAPPSSLGPPPYLDVTGDGWVTPADVLDIINVINGRVLSSGESEPAFAAVPPIGTGNVAVPTVDFASFDYDQSRRVESRLRQDREEAVSAIMGKWTPADEYLHCILAPSDTARPVYQRSADAARDEGQADNRSGNAEEDWLLFGLDQGSAADLLDELLDPCQLSWHQTGMGRSGVGLCRVATS